METKRTLPNICIVGTGGMAREVLLCLRDCFPYDLDNFPNRVCFLEKDSVLSQKELDTIPIIPQSKFNPASHKVIIAVGDVNLRKKIASDLPLETEFESLVHPSAIISDSVEMGEGSIIMAGTVLTCSIKIGKHCIIDRLSTIGHDVVIEDFFHLAPHSVLSGNTKIGTEVFIGTQAAVKENVSICNKVLIGMGTIVVKSITESGTYIGNPAKRIK